MDRNTIIGLSLIFVLILVWQQVMAPSAEELAAQKRSRDSIAQLEARQQLPDSLAKLPAKDTNAAQTPVVALSDSAKTAQAGAVFGPFAPAAVGEEKTITIGNDLMQVTLSNKGGRITGIELKQYSKVVEDSAFVQTKIPVQLLEDKKNKFEYFLPVASLPGGGISTGQLFFEATAQQENAVTFRASAGDGRYFEQTYTLSPDSYKIDYDIRFEGLNSLIANDAQEIKLNWVNFLDPIEINRTYERNYSTVYFKPTEEGADYCSCTADDSQNADGKALKWVAHSNQFFTTGLFADQRFNGAAMETQVFDLKNEDLKRLRSEVRIPYGHSASEAFSMSVYAGPNEFKRMKAMGDDFEDVIPFGWSIFGTINRWAIRPIFNFLSSFIGSAGLVILILTLFVKLLVYPLSYRMLYSQAKMAALKPQIETLKAKHKDDAQQVQVETMKMYREFGVNPLGGCLPMLLQMPIWFALYRFFPASIEFRQSSFLWATDLSSYDVVARLPFEIPMGFGSHISLFTLLWAGTTLIYTYYNTKHMDFSANPAMKWMQYIMPILFLGFFNSFASGLTCYLLFSNVINIGQTIVTNNYLIDKDKIKALLEKNKAQPKKKSAFAERLENAMKEQQRAQAEREQAKKKKK